MKNNELKFTDKELDNMFEKSPEDDKAYMKQFEYWEKVKEIIDEKKLQEEINNTELGEISGVIKAFGCYTFEMKDEFANYDTILSDDHSGRTAALFTKEIGDIARKKAGKEDLNVFFTNGIYRDDDANNEAVREKIKEWEPSMGRTLLIVENINSGERINGLCKILEEFKIQYTVAAVVMCERPSFYKNKFNSNNDSKFADNLKFGEISTTGLKIYDMKGCGIEKDPDKSSASPDLDRSVLPRERVKHRKTIKLIADEMKKLLD